MLKINHLHLLLLLTLIHMVSFGQDVRLKTSVKSQVRMGEQFQVVFDLNAEGDNFRGPDFNDWRVLTGPMSSTSSSIQIINGQMNKSFTQSFTYVLMPTAEGEFTIGSASITVDGKQIKSEAVTVKVTGANSPAQTQGNNPTNPSQSGEGITSKDLFLRAIVDKKNVVSGEQVIVTYRIYTRVPISSVTVSKLSSFPGFWTKNLLSENDALTQSTEIINGEEYITADIRKMALFPQKTGKLEIDPMELECVAQVRTQTNRRRTRDPFESFFNDPFFNRGISNVQKQLISEKLEINVNPLPTAGKPATFKGAVGQFGFQSAIDRTKLKTGEAINLQFTISGSGNVELVELPTPTFPPDFEVYDPKTSVSVKTSAKGISGTKKFEYLLIPRASGTFNIDPITFTYYDPVKKEYINLSSQQFEISVEKNESEENGRMVYSNAQEGIKYIGSDIRHIKTKNLKINDINAFFFGSATYLIILFALIAAFILVLVLTNKRRKLMKNELLVRNRKATKVARKRLKLAHKHLKNKEQNEFYTEMSQALWGYVRDKFSIAPSALSLDLIADILRDKNAPEDITATLIQTLNNCEFARFAPGESGKKMEELYNQGLGIIMKIEKTVKS
ncbi:MAG: BatD family protein [Bacteroidetes bacterium]|nr:BatD family protein [Bacteroidota bacterium]